MERGINNTADFFNSGAAASSNSSQESFFNEDVDRQSDFLDLASRRAEEAVSRRYEAAGWLRKMVGIVASKDLPNQPSEEEFRLGLRNGLILCNVLNKVNPGTIPRVVENPAPSLPVQDGAPLSAYQYFENVRNFLDAAKEIGLPCFEACDLEKGGATAKVVDCVLGLRAYSHWKMTGGTGSWKFGGNSKQPQGNVPKQPIKCARVSDAFTHSVAKSLQQQQQTESTPSLPRTQSTEATSSLQIQNREQLLKLLGLEQQSQQGLTTLILTLLSEKKSEEGSPLVDSMLTKLAEEVERRLAAQGDQSRKAAKDISANGVEDFVPKAKALPVQSPALSNVKVNGRKHEQREEVANTKEIQIFHNTSYTNLIRSLHKICDSQQKEIQELRSLLSNTKQGVHLMQMEWNDSLFKLGRQMCNLAIAAEGYHKVLEENRQLYNQVQDLKGSIRVYCRVRPFLPGQASAETTVDFIGEEGSIMIVNPAKKGKDARRTFTFNKVFAESSSQEEIFLDTRPLIRSVLDGYNVCIFAYGQTGSGKTYTMSGPKVINEESWGVNYRALNDLFHISKQRRDTFTYEVAVQMIEIYNEQVRDLLIADGSNKKLDIRNNSQQNGLNIPDANLVPVTSTSAVMELMKLGQKNRAVGSTALNDRSSRSHSVLTVHVQGREHASATLLRGCLHLIDLAGSERVDKSEATGERLKEAQHINKSLSALGDVIAALAQKNSHVPYRNSKLTQVLQDSLGGQAKTLMFVHISPEVDAYGETISTLKFAERVATVELGAARTNKESSDVRDLKEQVAQLKSALAKKETESRPPDLHTRMSLEFQKLHGVSPVRPRQSKGNGSVNSNQRQPMEDVANIEPQTHSSGKQSRPSFDQGYPSDILNATTSPMFGNSLSQIQRQIRQTPPSIKVNPLEQGNHIASGGMHDIFEDQGMSKWQENILVMDHEAIQNEMRNWDANDLEKTDDPSSIYCESYQASPDCEEEKFSMDQLNNLHKVIKSRKHDTKGKHFSNGQRSPYDAATTDESEVEMDTRSKDDYLTSDSSEADLLWQYKALNIPSLMPAEPISLTKKTQLTKSAERRGISPGPSAGARNDRRYPNGTREGRLSKAGLETRRPGSVGKFKQDARSARK